MHIERDGVRAAGQALDHDSIPALVAAGDRTGAIREPRRFPGTGLD